MENNGGCYLCLKEAHIEDVPHEHGQFVDVLCSGDCPQYQISTIARDEINGHELKRQIVLQNIERIAHSGEKPVVRFNSIKGEFEYESA